jgi:hypothetical protein
LSIQGSLRALEIEMRNEFLGLGVLAFMAASPAAFAAQASAAAPSAGGVAIDHKAVDCIVAGKYPKMNACFVPNSDVARARIYFRAEGGTSWYYVEMKSDAPCMSGILPKPRKEMIDKHVNYYVHVTDKSFTEGQTEEYDPLVVSSESQCKDKLVAAALPKAAVQVFPGIPAGFAAGGISTAAAVGGGVAIAGAAGGVYAATKGGDTTTTTFSPTTTSPTSGGTTTSTTSSTTSSTSSTTPAPTFRFSLKVSPTQGTEPLDVTVDMCGSVPVNSLRYFWDFDGDGVFDYQAFACSQTRTFKVNSVDVSPSGRVTTTTLPHHTWTVMGCAEPRDSNVEPQERKCGTASVDVEQAPTPIPKGSGVAAGRDLTLQGELDVDGATGQVVVNGTAAVYSGTGRSSAVAAGRRGQNRIEAQLVAAAGKPGTWRFDLGATPGMVGGSVRVIAGDVALVTADSVVFRLRGTSGERVVFTFETK